MPTSRFRALVPVAVVLVVLLAPLVAGAQTPLPGEEPEAAREWTWYLSWPILAGAFGLALLVLFSYLRLSGRFYGKEEAPKVRPQPQYAGVNAPAYPAPVGQPAPTSQPAPAQAAQQAAAPAPEAPAQETPAQAAEQPAPEPEPEEAPAAEARAEPQEEEKPAEEPAPEEKPAAEAAPEEKPEAEAAPEEKPAEEAAAGGDDVYERILQEQLDKGVSPKVAEGRAKAAALKAKRAQGGE